MAPLLFLAVVLLAGCAHGHNTLKLFHGNARSTSAPDGSTFRSDYQFHPEANGWLKVHRVPIGWYHARYSCQLEGARLASPLTVGLSTALRTLLQEARSGSIHIGMHSMHATNYFSTEGVHMMEMPLEWAEGEPNNLDDQERCLAMLKSGEVADVNCSALRPFICYREKVGIMAMNECGNHNKKYVKDARTGSCYKHHTEKTTWFAANEVCVREGGHLAIINSDTEAEVLKEVGRGSDYLFIGFYNQFREHGQQRWVTLDGKTLEEAGYARWQKNEPNNIASKEYCGSFVLRNDMIPGLNDGSCEYNWAFICEIEKPRVPLW